MPRAIWSGSISFGLVNIPVKLYSAVSRKTVHFNQLDARTNARIKQKRVSSDDGRRGALRADRQGLRAGVGRLRGRHRRRAGRARPQGAAHDRHRRVRRPGRHRPDLLRQRLLPGARQGGQALRAAGPGDGGVGQGRHRPLRDAHQAVPRRDPPQGRAADALDHGLRRRDQRPPPRSPSWPSSTRSRCPTRSSRWPASWSTRSRADFEPEKFQDTYREAVLELIERKAAGDEMVATPRPRREPDKVIDLMAALEASVAAAKQARGRHPTGRDGAEDEVDTDRGQGGRRRGGGPRAAARRPRPRSSQPRPGQEGDGQEAPDGRSGVQEVGLRPSPDRMA